MIQLIATLHALTARMRDDEGATAVEYGLMVALIAAIIVGAVGALGLSVQGTFNSVASSI